MQYFSPFFPPKEALWVQAIFSSISGIISKSLVNTPRGSICPVALYPQVGGCSCTRTTAASEDFHSFLSPMGRS